MYHGGTPIWRFHTRLCKFLRNISTNIWSLGKRTRHENGTVSKMRDPGNEVVLKPESAENATRVFSVDAKYFENEAFHSKTITLQSIIMTFPCPSFVGDRFVFKFLRRNTNGKHLMRFQIETSVFKFLRRRTKRP